MKLQPGIAPSILAANFLRLGENIQTMKDEGVSMFHFDIMDGHFVPNLSYGANIVSQVNAGYSIFSDVHLMIANPEKYLDMFIQAGARLITFHVEVVDVPLGNKLIHYLKEKNILVGISLKPGTPVDALQPYLSLVDLVLVMSVEPGFGGQVFIPSALEKIAYFKEQRQRHQWHYLIEVDGGIDDVSGRQCLQAGADILVAGSYLFQKKDLHDRLVKLGHHSS